MSFLRHVIGKSIGNFFQVVFNFKMLIALVVSFIIGWVIENKELDLIKIIGLWLIYSLIAVWIFQKMVEIIREVDGKKYESNGILVNLFKIIWNGIVAGIVVVVVGLIVLTVVGSANITDGRLGIIFIVIGGIIYLWYATKIVFFPYCIVADGLDNPISISLGLTENKFFKVLILEIICHAALYYEAKMFIGVDNIVLLMTKFIIISITSLFIMILYYNSYERLKEFQYAK